VSPPIPLLWASGNGSRVDPSELSLPPSLCAELDAGREQWGLFLLQYVHLSERDRFAALIERLYPGAERVIANETEHPDWPPLRDAIVAAATGASLVQLFGLEAWLDPTASHGQAEARLRAWNRGRDGFAHRVNIPLLLWLRPEQVRMMARLAPDLWSWRSGVHELIGIDPAEGAGLERQAPLLHPGWSGGVDGRTLEQRKTRIEELSAHLDAEVVRNDSPTLQLSFLSELADLLLSVGKPDEALRRLQTQGIALAAESGSERQRAIILGRIADILNKRGELDEALRIYHDEVLPAVRRPGDEKVLAIAQGKIADILQARGELEEALRIRREEELPVYERLGDLRASAVTQGQVADILQSRGQLGEALQIRREEELPVYEQLGDLRSIAITYSKIADIMHMRGDLEESLRIMRKEVLPVYERLGDARSRAIAQGKIADILQSRGELEEALRIRREEELPMLERLGDVRALLVGHANLAINLAVRGREEDRDEIWSLLQQAHSDAERLRLPEAQTIRQLIAEIFGD
jgi:tetratricopeptide (TPR) repeat protein